MTCVRVAVLLLAGGAVAAFGLGCLGPTYHAWFALAVGCATVAGAFYCFEELDP